MEVVQGVSLALIYANLRNYALHEITWQMQAKVEKCSSTLGILSLPLLLMILVIVVVTINKQAQRQYK